MATRKSAEVFSLGEFLAEELHERQWSHADLAKILGCQVSVVDEMIQGERGISAETARDLGAALGTSPELWMNLDVTYQLSRLRVDTADDIARRAKLFTKATMN